MIRLPRWAQHNPKVARLAAFSPQFLHLVWFAPTGHCYLADLCRRLAAQAYPEMKGNDETKTPDNDQAPDASLG